MERRSFLKRLGILAGASLVPDKLLTATEFIEKRVNPAASAQGLSAFSVNDLYKNHMTVQRRTISISGNAQSDVMWYEFSNSGVGKYAYWINYSPKQIEKLKTI